MKMKRVAIIVLANLFLWFNVMSASASEGAEKVYSVEEYTSIIQEICDEANVEFDVEVPEGLVITEEVLRSGVENTECFVEYYLENQNSVVMEENAGKAVGTKRNGGVSTFAMPVTSTVYGNTKITSPYGYAYICATANVTVNVQNSNVMSVNSLSVQQLGASMNFDSWTTNSSSVSTNSPSNGWITVNASGTAVYSFTEPIGGIKLGYTCIQNVSIQIACD